MLDIAPLKGRGGARQHRHAHGCVELGDLTKAISNMPGVTVVKHVQRERALGGRIRLNAVAEKLYLVTLYSHQPLYQATWST